tara:strand:+ start:256 stop:735 length:480 start_codon:yes stop_codon:yes gene_type:complete
MQNGSKMIKNKILSILKQIPDPEIPAINIVELGVVRKIICNENITQVSITPTYIACPAIDLIGKLIKEKLDKFGYKNINIKMVYYPTWTTDWISEETKLKLKNYGISPPNLINSKNKKIICPKCNSNNTSLKSFFSSTPCKSLHKCNDCIEPFEYFKCI